MFWFFMVLALVLAVVAGYGLGRRPIRAATGTTPLSADAEHVLDLPRSY